MRCVRAQRRYLRVFMRLRLPRPQLRRPPVRARPRRPARCAATPYEAAAPDAGHARGVAGRPSAAGRGAENWPREYTMRRRPFVKPPRLFASCESLQSPSECRSNSGARRRDPPLLGCRRRRPVVLRAAARLAKSATLERRFTPARRASTATSRRGASDATFRLPRRRAPSPGKFAGARSATSPSEDVWGSAGRHANAGSGCAFPWVCGRRDG